MNDISSNYFRGTRWLPTSLTVLAALGIIAYLLHVLDRTSDQAEQQALEAAIHNLHTGMQVAKHEAITYGRGEPANEWEGSNPIRWLQNPPGNYVGECSGAIRANLKESLWCFDPSKGELVFRPRSPKKFKRVAGDPNIAPSASCREQIWRVIKNKNITPNPAYYGFDGLELVETGNCRWIWD